MQIKPMCPEYAVSEQITVADVTAIAQAGFKSILCNRPDGEIGPDDQMAAIASAADQAGLVFADNPFDHATFGADVIARQSDLLASLPAPVLAYCASGTRCSIVWAFTQAGVRPTQSILDAARANGYALDHLAPALDDFAQTR